MKRLVMNENNAITFEEGCEKYLENCKQRNLRDGTINHYKQSYTQFFKCFRREMLLNDFTEQDYDNYVIYLRKTFNNDVTINAYLRDLITTLHFLMRDGYMQEFKMKSIKVDKHNVKTYTDNELILLLEKPNIKKCSFTEYQSWVMTNFLFTTGVRQRSLMHIKICDLDFDNNMVNITVTKNRKPLLIPLNKTMINILKEYLKYRQYKSTDDYLFCNVFGQQLVKSTCYHMLYEYNKRRGVETTGIHRYRHTFAKQWIINGGNVVTLSRLLGHSNLSITQNYINLLVSDLSKQVEEIDLINKFSGKHSIKMR